MIKKKIFFKWYNMGPLNVYFSIKPCTERQGQQSNIQIIIYAYIINQGLDLEAAANPDTLFSN